MPPKKKPKKDLPLEGPSQMVEGQVHETIQTTAQLQTSTGPCPVTAEIRCLEEPPEPPLTQVEVPVMNTSTLKTQQQPQRQEIKAQEDQQQDSDEEIEAIIEDELTRLR
jgi:hypothetical protein